MIKINYESSITHSLFVIYERQFINFVFICSSRTMEPESNLLGKANSRPLAKKKTEGSQTAEAKQKNYCKNVAKSHLKSNKRPARKRVKGPTSPENIKILGMAI